MTRLAIASHDLSDELFRRATPAELATRLDIPLKKVEALFEAARSPRSLDDPTSDRSSRPLLDKLSDPSTVSPMDGALQQDLRGKMLACLDRVLTSREREIIRLRFGIQCRGAHSLMKIALKYGVSRERIRQIECGALAKIKRSFIPRTATPQAG